MMPGKKKGWQIISAGNQFDCLLHKVDEPKQRKQHQMPLNGTAHPGQSCSTMRCKIRQWKKKIDSTRKGFRLGPASFISSCRISVGMLGISFARMNCLIYFDCFERIFLIFGDFLPHQQTMADGLPARAILACANGMTEVELGLGRCCPYLQCVDSPRPRSGASSTHQFGLHCCYGWRGSEIYDGQAASHQIFAMFTPCGLAAQARGRLQGCGKRQRGCAQLQNTKPGADACPGT